MAKIVFDLVN